MKYRKNKSGRKSHDLNLSKWGPYSKKYIGISHIPSVHEGNRFDISIFPGLFRRGITIPNVMWESGYYPWESSTDLKYYSHRHQLLWKDQIYSDISYSILDESEVLFCCKSVNNTNTTQAIIFHHLASLSFPPKASYSKENLRSVELKYPNDFLLVKGLDYTSIHLDETNPLRNLSPDGIIWGEKRDHGYTNGAGLGGGFGTSPSDKVTYDIPEQWDYSEKVYLRCRIAQKETTEIQFQKGISGFCSITGTDQFELIPLSVKADKDLSTFQISCDGKALIEIDSIIFCTHGSRKKPEFIQSSRNPKPSILQGPNENTLILSYEGLEKHYGISWEIDAVVREFDCDEIDSLMQHNVHEHNYKYFKGSGDGHYTDIFTRPLYIKAQSEMSLTGKICCGTKKEVREKLSSFRPSSPEVQDLIKSSRDKKVSYNIENKYSFSMERMAATVLTNVVFPVRVQGSWIRHHTPGRWWDSLYTWDSGFIGLGFSTLDMDRATENLNCYTTLPGNPEAAFIHHGSPVPTQFFLYQEIFNKSGSRDFLKKFYPQMLQYHMFMCGHFGSSTMGSLNSGLLKTWDYFYSSSGMDDYPAQLEVHRRELEENTSPVITTAISIRTAKILKRAAIILGEPVDELNEDIKRLTLALQKNSWDRHSGYFSYAIHDKDGNAIDYLKDESGHNYNCGFEGIYPINADICTQEQQEIIVKRMFSKKHLWTDCGLTAIDQSAPYHKDDGYWNGTVWMSHQWIFWKSMLDLGYTDEAYKIASTALDLWKREVEENYLCFEHFICTSGKGAGWHHFGGLSSPVLHWYASYFQLGNISTGHNTWVISRDFSKDFKRMKASLSCDQSGDNERAVIVTLDRNLKEITALWQGRPVQFNLRGPGIIELLLSGDDGRESTLEIHGV